MPFLNGNKKPELGIFPAPADVLSFVQAVFPKLIRDENVFLERHVVIVIVIVH